MSDSGHDRSGPTSTATSEAGQDTEVASPQSNGNPAESGSEDQETQTSDSGTDHETQTSDPGIDDTATLELLDGLIRAVSAQKSTYCCGGTVKIATDQDSRSDSLEAVEKPLTSPPVTLRWDLPGGKAIRKLTLPPIVEGEAGQAAIKELIQDGSAATFGKGTEEVLDESYRKAIKLDCDQFSANFNPHDVGILDHVAQTLLPGILRPLEGHKTKFDDIGVIADLYKLNTYSAPSGKFRPHVDTPRGPTHFGSLVVCLPNPHQGGQLRVVYEGQEQQWDWSNESGANIEWAAFYSDCEHELKEVTSGNRVTLTYNLYAHERQGGIMRRNSILDLSSFPLHRRMKELLVSEEFMPHGGTLGFYCRHAYAHTNNRSKASLPFALKGFDAILFSICHYLGLKVTLQPVMGILDEELGHHRDSLRGAELVGKHLRDIELSSEGGNEGEKLLDILDYAWEARWRKDIEWIGSKMHEELALVHLTYGNQPGIDYHYSSAAILVRVPDYTSKARSKLRSG